MRTHNFLARKSFSPDIHNGLRAALHPSAGPYNKDPSMMANIRLSRVSHPRATLWAVALLIIVFVGFGVLAQTSIPMEHTSSMHLDRLVQGSSWLTQLTAALK